MRLVLLERDTHIVDNSFLIGRLLFFSLAYWRGSQERWSAASCDAERGVGCKRVHFFPVREEDLWCGQHSKQMY